MYAAFVKRFFDYFVSATLLVLLFPLILIFASIMFFVNDGKLFFIQARSGRYGKSFNLIKFRSMNDKKGADGKLLADKDRLSLVGKIIRSTSIDELPQLWNVLRGDMSLVGPRPLLVQYLPLYNQFQSRRHEVRPGITGWAQVNGRNAISWQKRFELDVYYVENLSFFLDLKIIYMTAMKVLKREGINASDSTTMQAFKGN